MKNILAIFVLLLSLNINAQSVLGTWETFDEKTKKPNSLVKLEVKDDGKLYGYIIDIYKDDKTGKCIDCKGRHKDQPVMGLEFVWGFKKKNRKNWSGGKIIDPRNGKVYKCHIKLVDDNTLKVRGYIGSKWMGLGKTKIWKKPQ